MIETTLEGLRVVNGANTREHFQTRARRARTQRATLRARLGPELVREALTKPQGPWVVTFTRVAPRPFDDDGLAISFKHLRDEVTGLLGHDDAPSSPIRWRYLQERGAPKTYAVRIEVAPADEGFVCPACERLL